MTTNLPVHVTKGAGKPMAVQIADQVRSAVAGGVLSGGERLPSSRELARTLGVSRTVATAAYTQLFAEGWLEGRHGSGTFVADGVGSSSVARSQPPPSRAARAPRSPSIELRPGIPWAAGIDQAMWRRAFRYAGARPPSAWSDPAGLLELRTDVAGYLRRARGLTAGPEQVLITRGVAAGLALLAAEVIKPGDRVGVEEPGYPKGRDVLARAGATVIPCHADSSGLVTSDLPRDLRLVYTTPAHQYPLGGRLPVRRRQELIAWARQTGALIVEDDYDSEFRYDVAPLPSLYSMAPDRVVYLGTTTKVLTPALGLGWLVAEPGLTGRLTAFEDRVPEPVQHAVLALLRGGDLERHIRRMRLEYARRRSAVVGALGETGFRLLGDTAGMHVVLELPARALASSVVEQARLRDVELWTLDRYFAGPPTRAGLIIGYGTTTEPQVRRACGLVRELLVRLRDKNLGSWYRGGSGTQPHSGVRDHGSLVATYAANDPPA